MTTKTFTGEGRAGGRSGAVPSIAAFVQQLAVGYVAKGYRYYVTARIPRGKDPLPIDAKLTEIYEADLSASARYRRRCSGQAVIQYLRHDQFLVLIATEGRNDLFYEREGPIKDIWHTPLSYGGYSVASRHSTVTGRRHASVRIQRREYLMLKRYFEWHAPRMTHTELMELFRALPYEPYAPVRRQLLNIRRSVNRIRVSASLEPIPVHALRFRRKHVRVFPLIQPFASCGLSSPDKGEP